MHENGKSSFLPNLLCLTIQKKSWWPLLSFRFFGISKTLCHILIFRQIFWSHSTEKLREEPSNFSESFKFEVSKKFMRKNRIPRLSVENFLSQSAGNFRWGTLRYIRKVRLSKNFMTNRLKTLFSVEFFSRIPPLNFVGEPLCVSESLGHRKLFCSVGAAHFSVGFSGQPILKNLVGNPFSRTQYFGYRNFLCKRTENQVFLPNILCLTIPKKFVVTTSNFHIIGISKTFCHIMIFRQTFWSHSTEKLRQEPYDVS